MAVHVSQSVNIFILVVRVKIKAIHAVSRMCQIFVRGQTVIFSAVLQVGVK